MAKAFISYKRNADPDERLADYFVQYLTQQGHQVFIDKQITLGQKWPTIIEQKIKESDFLIVLLSEYSVVSDMVAQEVSMAHRLKKIILPVRVAYEGTPPYDLASYLGKVQYMRFPQDGNEATIGQKLHLSMNQLLQENTTVVEPNKEITFATDGKPMSPDVVLASPLPAFDPQWLKELDASGGAVRLESRFYIERPADTEAKEQILQEGVTIRIKGSRQVGKTSLLARLSQHANDNNLPITYIDFQEMDDHHFQDLETLLRYLAERIAEEQQTNVSPDDYWQGQLKQLGPKDKLTRFFGQEVLGYLTNPLVLIMDEVDRVFAFENYRNDFFSLIRSWHNKRAMIKSQAWKKLNLVLSYSTEAFLFITDLNQSPFNVGTDFNLIDFDRSQVERLNWQHGSPIQTTQEMDSIMELLQGHPFLVRKALYTLAVQKLSVDELLKRAYDDDGPFSDHLHHYLLRLNKHPELRAAMKSVIENHTCPTDLHFYQLRSGGLVHGPDRANVRPRCGLYIEYFKTHL